MSMPVHSIHVVFVLGSKALIYVVARDREYTAPAYRHVLHVVPDGTSCCHFKVLSLFVLLS